MPNDNEVQFSIAHSDAIEKMKSQLLICFVRRLGGKVSMPVAEIDNTGGVNLIMRLVDNVFTFEVQPKG